MGQDTKIEWCDHTFNPWRGCTKVSAGCANCYAETLSRRNPGVLGMWGPTGTRVVAAESQWRQPLKWDREAQKAGVRRRVFCASLADVFEDWGGVVVDSRGVRLPGINGVRDRLFDLIDDTPNLDWLLLTKRPENFARFLPQPLGIPAAPDNVWLGVSVENQQAADERIPLLLQTPAAVRFLSVEPMLGPVDLDIHPRYAPEGTQSRSCWPLDNASGQRIHWVIVGGESGGTARRPLDIAWVRMLVRQCKAAGAACFVKQLGASYYENWACGSMVRVGLRDRKGGDVEEWPDDLRVREFPREVGA